MLCWRTLLLRPPPTGAAAGTGAIVFRRGLLVTASAASTQVGEYKEFTKTSITEFEHRFDGAVKYHLPRPGPGGFARGSFIGWRRDERVRDRAGGASGAVLDTRRLEGLYELMSTVGEGAFGIVHSARHRRTGEIVAIKAIDHDKVKEKEALQSEVEFLKVADHPNVIRYYETLEDEHHHYLVMEMCSGGALSEHIRSWHDDHGPGIHETDIARIVVQMLRGLAYCHAHSIVHRDVKPQNFLFGCGSPQAGSPVPIACSGDADAPLKLVDFGISGVVRSDRPNKRLLTRRAGTDGYIAPEVLGGQPYGPSADIFSLGAVMHKMLTGLAPQWEAERRVYKFPGKVRWASMSPLGRAFLQRLLDPNPRARPTASEAIQDPWFSALGVAAPENFAEIFGDCMRSVCSFSRRTKLQRSIMYSMVAFAPLHSHHMEKLRLAFLAADKSTFAGISFKDFGDIARLCGIDSREAQACFAAVNASQTGRISYSEWLAGAAPQDWYDQPQHAQRAFETLDVQRHGYIVANDLCQLLPGCFDRDRIDREIRGLFPAGNGRLTFRDFCALSGRPAAENCW